MMNFVLTMLASMLGFMLAMVVAFFVLTNERVMKWYMAFTMKRTEKIADDFMNNMSM